MKSKQLSTKLFAVTVMFLGLVLLNNVLLERVRVDLTEQALYSITDGTKQLLTTIDEPVQLYFFFSEKTSEGIPHIRNYASRVKSLLREYEVYSNGQIQLQFIDPEPFSEAEDRATEFGLTAASIGGLGDNLFFGLGGSNTLDSREIIPFFDPNQEAFLEYEISKLIYKLTDPDPIHISLVTGLPMQGGMDPMRGGMIPAWTIYEQLEQLHSIELVDLKATSLPEKTDVLFIAHPQALNDDLLYAIDQYVLKGGKAIVLVDPFSESAPPTGQGPGTSTGSELGELLAAWGVEFDNSKIVLDAANGLEIRDQNNGLVRHMAYIGLFGDVIDGQDRVTSGLQALNFASAGVLKPAPEATTEFTTLVTTSPYSNTSDASQYMLMSQNPRELAKNFQPLNEVQTIIARISGQATSAYPGSDKEGFIAESSNIQLVIASDTDFLTDRFWVNKTNMFGSMIAQPFANNGDLITNIVEHMGGSSALISVRGRGEYSRPFDVVQEMVAKAETQFREKEEQLQAQLQATEQKITQLQDQQGQSGFLTMNSEQEAAIESFLQEKLEIRKALRNVRHQFEQDIETLGSWLKFINIALMPLILTFILAFIARRYRNKSAV